MSENDAPKKQRWRIPYARILFRLTLVGVALAGLAVTASLLLLFLLYDHVTQDGKAGPRIEVAIPEGANGGEIGKILQKSGLIEFEGMFRLAMYLDKTKAPLKFGTYRLPKGYSATQILHELQKGPDYQEDAGRFRVTIPEGLTIAQIAERFDDPQAFLEKAADPELRQRLGVKTATLEGYLMPNTYFFNSDPTPADVVERMVEQFEVEYARLSLGIPGSERYDRNTILTIASLVEEEARVEEERPLVAAVMYNRIDKKMPLQMDSTLQYALGKYGQRLLNEDKEVDSPYNTYKHPGLPPGPICNPGVDSIRAAMQPADVKYLYFVSNADGKTHTFSNTLSEHESAVAKYRREIEVQRRELQQAN